jgi:hypothetical protein
LEANLLQEKYNEHQAAMRSNEEIMAALRKKEKSLKLEGAKVHKGMTTFLS